MSTPESETDNPATSSGAAASADVTPGKALVTLVGVLVVVAGYIALTSALGIPDFWAGFMFILYWGGIQHTETGQLPASVIGAFFGVFLLYLSHAFTDWLGDAGLLAFAAVMIVVIYCQILGVFTVIVNLMAMLYLTVGTMPLLQEHGNVADIASALALGIVYFAGIILGGKWLMARKSEGVKDPGSV